MPRRVGFHSPALIGRRVFKSRPRVQIHSDKLAGRRIDKDTSQKRGKVNSRRAVENKAETKAMVGNMKCSPELLELPCQPKIKDLQ